MQWPDSASARRPREPCHCGVGRFCGYAIFDEQQEIFDMLRADSASVTSSSLAHPHHPQPLRPAAVILTAREKEVLQWSAIGKSSWEIGRICNCTEAGVNYHFANIRRKFGVSSRGCAVVKALELGLIELS